MKALRRLFEEAYHTLFFYKQLFAHEILVDQLLRPAFCDKWRGTEDPVTRGAVVGRQNPFRITPSRNAIYQIPDKLGHLVHSIMISPLTAV